MFIEILGIVCNRESSLLSFAFQSMCQAEIAKFKMVSVGLAISGYVYQRASLGNLNKFFHQSFTGRQRTFKRDGPCCRAMVEEHCQRASQTIRVEIAIGTRRVGIARAGILPRLTTCGANATRLLGGQNYKTQSLLNQQIQCLIVASSFRQPKRFGFASKAITKIRQ